MRRAHSPSLQTKQGRPQGFSLAFRKAIGANTTAFGVLQTAAPTGAPQVLRKISPLIRNNEMGRKRQSQTRTEEYFFASGAERAQVVSRPQSQSFLGLEAGRQEAFGNGPHAFPSVLSPGPESPHSDLFIGNQRLDLPSPGNKVLRER